MLYAKEVTHYLYVIKPNEDIRMSEIVTWVEPAPKDQAAKHRIRMAVYRVLQALMNAGCVIERPSSHKRGGFSTYRWVVRESAT